MNEENKGILLETGTNELEIVTYTIGKNLFCINVMKVREIIQPTEVTEIPDSHPAVEGVIQLRGEIIPVINLSKALQIPSSMDKHSSKFIISELSQMKVVFRVDDVQRIQRISWQQIEEPSSLSMGIEEIASGIVKIKEKVILMLDYEKLVYNISPSSRMNSKDIEVLGLRERSNKKIFVAEDSMMLRTLLEETLRAAGYNNLTFFKNGEEVIDYFESVSNKEKEITDLVDLIITDIEMPKMDGHYITRKIKENPITKDIPIIIFSSLITPELKHKGDSVGADAQISKPEIVKLIKTVDHLTSK